MKKNITILFMILTILGPLSAERVGLVLSGGGARGFTHLGVLKVFEKNRIPIDVISGTSIGALIGSLYCCGYSAEEIEQILLAQDWKNLLSEKPIRKYIPILERNIDTRFLFNFKISNWRIKLKSGLSSGQKIIDFLSQYTEYYTMECSGDFDKLPIPLRITATDIVTGEPVVFKKGNLTDAIRASMALPVALTPYKIKDKVLIDGFTFENIPVNPIKGIVDKIIISNSSAFNTGEKSDYQDVFKIFDRTMEILTQKQYNDLINEDIDLILNHELADYSFLSFDKKEKLIKVGEQTALNNLFEIKKIAGERREVRKKRKREEYNIDKIEIKGINHIDENIVRREIDIKPGARLDLKKLSEVSNHLYGMDLFDKVKYSLKKKGSGRVNVIFDLKEKKEGDLFFGYSYDDYYRLMGSSVLRFSTASKYYFKSMLKVTAGRYNSLDLNIFMRKFFRTNLMINMNTFMSVSKEKLYSNHNEYKEYSEYHSWIKIAGGYYLSSNWLLYCNLVREWEKLDTRNLYLSKLNFRFLYDTIDNTNIPNEGLLTNISWDKSFNKTEFQKFSLELKIYNRIGKHTFYCEGDYKISNKDLPLLEKYILGGYDDLPGYNIKMFRTNNYYNIHTGIRFLIRKYRTLIKRALYFSIDAGAANISDTKKFDNNSDNLLTGYGASIMLDTVIGILKLEYGRNKEEEDIIYLGINKLKF